MMAKNKNIINKVVKIHFASSKESLTGVFLNENDSWILLTRIPVDFQIDGYVIINQNNISKIERSTKELFKEQVIRANRKDTVNDSQNFLASIIEDPYKVFEKEKLLVQIENSSNDVVFIGNVLSNDINGINLKPINPQGDWVEEMKVLHNDIWCISFENDYVISLWNYHVYKQLDEK